MTAQSLIARLLRHEGLNFVLTNRIPRRLATRFMGWFSTIEQPVVRDISIAIWRLFCSVDLSEAKKKDFVSLRDCFIRELKDGVRSINRDPENPRQSLRRHCRRGGDDRRHRSAADQGFLVSAGRPA